jgi:hypothetical protein
MKSKFSSLFYQGLISISFVFLISLLCLTYFFSFFNKKEESTIYFDKEPLIIGGNRDIIKIESPVRIISIDTIESKNLKDVNQIPDVSIKTKSIKEDSENEKISEENEECENMADIPE